MKRKELTPAYYPVFINLRDKKSVVVGGGAVAMRKVKALLEHGAKVEVISPDLSPELIQLAENDEISLKQRKYQNGDLAGAFIAIAATDNRKTNEQVVKEAHQKTVLVNVVDDAESSDFIVPSCLRRGDLTIAVSTAGRSPALARKIRTRLEREIGEEYTLLANLVGEVRDELEQQKIKIDGDGWQEALELDLLLELLKKGEKAKARTILLRNLKNKAKIGIG